MAGETKHGAPGHGIECTEFEALLTEAIEGQLTGVTLERFEAHRRVCPVCGPLFNEARAGHEWLHSLEEVEPPVNLVHNILAATIGTESSKSPVISPAVMGIEVRARGWWDSFVAPVVAFVRQPRFVMSFGMIFFTFSLGLSAAGVKPGDLAKVDVRPSAVKHAYYTTQGKVVKFYDNIRFVYEIESRVREFKRESRPAEPGPEEQKQNHKNNTSGQPDEKQERNSSREENQPVLAELSVPSFELRTTSFEPPASSHELRATCLTRQAANYQSRTANYELRAPNYERVARSSQLEARSCLPAVVTTTRRFV
jgi:hypothetical protein